MSVKTEILSKHTVYRITADRDVTDSWALAAEKAAPALLEEINKVRAEHGERPVTKIHSDWWLNGYHQEVSGKIGVRIMLEDKET